MDGKRKLVVDECDGVIRSSLHGRKRREERGISKAAFEAAVKNGEKIPTINPKTGAKQWLFDYKPGGITVITDYSCTQEVTSGAHSCWGLNIEKVPITKEIEEEHHQAVKDSTKHELWKSHAVVVVDQSGSMRMTDTKTGVSRSDLAWVCLAVDYVGRRLRTGEATSRDYFTLVELGVDGTCLIKEHPVTWVLYNKIVDLLRTRRPLGHGNYLPALDTARDMLLSNKKGSCLLQLVFLTDGAPSDLAPRGCGFNHADYHVYAVTNQIRSIACKFGSRLTFGAISVGQGRYDALEAMVRTAKDYNCSAYHFKSSLKSDDMSSAFMSMSTLLSSTKLTVTDMVSNRQRVFRDLDREPKSCVGVYNYVYHYLDGGWLEFVGSSLNKEMPNVRKTFFNKKSGKWEYPEVVFNDSKAVGVAVRENIFGEGSERAVRRVREIDANGKFVGPELVGKESLFVENTRDYTSFHRTFFIVQQLAKRMAAFFNKQLLQLPGVDRLVTPTVDFLDCYVLQLRDETNSEYSALLVEKMLDHTKYKKFNNNDGYVLSSSGKNANELGNNPDTSFSIDDIPQAYSHFTYLASKRKFLVCDLQGVLNTDVEPPIFELTDPAIHYSKMTSRKDFGRTDRGEHGIQDFLETHECSNLCHMLLKCWIDDPLDSDILQYEEALSVPSPNLLVSKKGILVNPNTKIAANSDCNKSVRFVV